MLEYQMDASGLENGLYQTTPSSSLEGLAVCS